MDLGIIDQQAQRRSSFRRGAALPVAGLRERWMTISVAGVRRLRAGPTAMPESFGRYRNLIVHVREVPVPILRGSDVLGDGQTVFRRERAVRHAIQAARSFVHLSRRSPAGHDMIVTENKLHRTDTLGCHAPDRFGLKPDVIFLL